MSEHRPPRTSQVLNGLAAGFTGERVSLGDIDAAMQDRAFGLLMLVFALPNLLPVSIPGMSAVTGLPLVLIGFQLLAGASKPWLPSWLARRSFPRTEFARFLSRALPWLERIEKLLRPRLAGMTRRGVERFLIGGLAVVLAATLALPIPFGNMLPAFALVLFALGLLERDGVAVLAGLLVGLAGLAVVAGIYGGSASFLLDRFGHLLAS